MKNTNHAHKTGSWYHFEFIKQFPTSHPVFFIWESFRGYFAENWGVISLNSALKSFKYFRFILPSCTLNAKYVTFWVMIISRLIETQNHPYSQNTRNSWRQNDKISCQMNLASVLGLTKNCRLTRCNQICYLRIPWSSWLFEPPAKVRTRLQIQPWTKKVEYTWIPFCFVWLLNIYLFIYLFIRSFFLFFHFFAI